MTQTRKLKYLLGKLTTLRENVANLIYDVKEMLGPAAVIVEDFEDLLRLQKDNVTNDLTGNYMSDILLQTIYRCGVSYDWLYGNTVFRVEPVKTGDDAGFTFTDPDGFAHSVPFNSIILDCVDFSEGIWTMMEARLTGLADAYKKEKPSFDQNGVLVESEAMKERVEELKEEIADKYDLPVPGNDDTNINIGRGQYSHKSIEYYGQ